MFSFCIYVALWLVLMQMYDLYSYTVKHKGDKMPLWFYLSLCKSAVLRLHMQCVTPVKSFFQEAFFFFEPSPAASSRHAAVTVLRCGSTCSSQPPRQGELPGVRLCCSKEDIWPGGQTGRMRKPPTVHHFFDVTLVSKPRMLLRTQIYQELCLLTKRGACSFQKLNIHH